MCRTHAKKDKTNEFVSHGGDDGIAIVAEVLGAGGPLCMLETDIHYAHLDFLLETLDVTFST